MTKSPWKYMPPAGPVLSITLIGLVFLSALLYYRSVKIQRYLEPALAMSQPRNEFAKSIKNNFEKEFGVNPIRGLKAGKSSLVMEPSFLFNGDGTWKRSAQADVKRLARIFLSLMEDSHTRADISLVLIIARFPSFGASGGDAAKRMEAQRMIGLIQDALFQAEPELGRKYSTYFAAAAQPTTPHERTGEEMEFRVIPSEQLHIEVLQKLVKYAF